MPVNFLDFYKSLSSDPQKRGRQFELFVKWFLQTDPEWSTQVEQVWLWNEYPERWGTDCGIDLMFRHKNGDIWAVQAKCYSPAYHITKEDVDKFLSESNRKHVTHRLLIATTDLIGQNARQVCEAQEKPVVRFLLSDFESADLEYPSSFDQLSMAKRKSPPKPREHQIEAITAVALKMEHTDRGQLIMACGTGKTYVTLWIKECLAAKLTLVLVPSLGLLSQILREWTFAASYPFDVLCVCSDQTVGKRGEDEAIHSIADLAFPVTSSVDEVRQFLAKRCDRVVFSTYQSSAIISEAQADSTIPDFDLTVADEAHRCAGKVGTDFTAILDSSLIRSKKRLFATATPRTYSSRIKQSAEERGVDVVGMDDTSLFGEVLYALPFGEAIARKLLTDYRIVIIGVDNPTIAQWIEDRELVRTDTGIETDMHSLAAQIGLLKAIKDYDLKRVISFHGRVKRAEEFARDIRQSMEWIKEKHRPAGTLKTDFVSGNMPAINRKLKLDKLKELSEDERSILSNARCLSEGVDVPSLDGVAFIDPRSSQVDIIQAVGRAIRLSPDKKAGTIVLPVFIEDGQDAEASINASNFKPIWDVLNALKAHDDVLATELDQIRTEMGRKSVSDVSAESLRKISIDLPITVDSGFGGTLRTHLVEKATESWDFWFGLLEAYADREGHSRVAAKYKTADGFRLGSWVNAQRNYMDRITIERKTKLEALPGWTWDANSDRWEQGFHYLKEFVEKEGHCRVLQTYYTKDGYPLGTWVSKQRSMKSRMLLERKTRLELLPGWEWVALLDNWEDGFRHLIEFVNREGHCRTPQTYCAENAYRLGGWVANQRSEKDVMTIERKSRLENLPGWSWKVNEDNWQVGFQHLIEFVDKNGHSKVSRNYISDDEYCLGRWVNRQRTRKTSLTEVRVMQLESLPVWTWDVLTDKWEEGFLYLKEFADREGHCKPLYSYKTPDGIKLSQWVKSQRSRKENLPNDRQTRLEALPGWSWNLIEEQWEEGFRHLIDFIGQKKHARIPASYHSADGYKLGQWVTVQRSCKSRLPQKRIIRLEALPEWTWDPFADMWEEGFRNLKVFADREKHCRVSNTYRTQSGYRLGGWVVSQRGNKDNLSEEKRIRLESLPGWTWNAIEEQWEDGFRHLQEFIQQNGHCRVSGDYISDDGYRIGNWVNNQRSNKDRLHLERKSRLEALPGWCWYVLTDKWEKGINCLNDFVKREGHCRVSAKYITTDGYRLGSWIHNQRTIKESLSEERRKRLETIPGWSWDVLLEQWETGYYHLLEYTQGKDHCRILNSYKTEDGYRLGQWISAQRNKKDSLTAEQRTLLESLPGWTWDVLTDKWERGFFYLQQYVNCKGNCMVAQTYCTDDGFRLGSWVRTQRAKKMKMSNERRERLLALSGWTWNAIEEKWEEGFCYLQQFVDCHGHCKIGTKYKTSDGFSLGQWVDTQRRSRSKMSKEQIERIELLTKWSWK